jgi:hypothetical protein
MNDNSRRMGGSIESHLDRAIDRAVRDMMDVDPRPGFRHRVLGRLDPSSARWTLVPRFAMTAGALAAVVLAVFVIGRDRGHDAGTDATPSRPPAVQSAARDAGPAVSTPAAATPPQRRRGDPGRRPRRLTREPIPIPRVANVFGTRTNGIAAAAVPESDAVWPASLPDTRGEQPSPIAPIVIPPIESPAPIVIPPLNPRGPGGER